MRFVFMITLLLQSTAYAAKCDFKLSHILAVSANGVIGIDNDLPWTIPEDMQFFLDKTQGKTMIMGRKTFESGGHPMPDRFSIVVSKNPNYLSPAPSVVIKNSVESAIAYCHSHGACGDEVFIIGGGEIYRASMHLVDTIYLTRIHKDFVGDVTYPEVDLNEFKLVDRRDRPGPIPFSYLTYQRRR